MRLERIETGFRAIVPCKLNLRLDVLGQRQDGYHDLDTIMVAVSLCDELEIRTRDDGRIVCDVELPADRAEYLTDSDPAWRIPRDSSNLVVRALELLRHALGGGGLGASVRLRKRIPAQAGLGGGSADAAGALVLGSLLWTGGVCMQTIGAIASQLGSDVNFFLEGHQGGLWIARCTGRGERILPIDCAQALDFVVLHPPAGCNTAEVFALHRERAAGNPGNNSRTSQFGENGPGNMEQLIDAIKHGRLTEIGALLFNGLETGASLTTDWIERSAKCFDRYDPLGHCMTGSGSARFCLCHDRAYAEKIGAELRLIGEQRVYHVRMWETSSIEKQIQGVRNIA